METISRLCGVVVLSTVAASCGGGTDGDAIQNEAAPPAAAVAVGTAGEQVTAAEPEAASAPAPGELPGTAGSMPLIGGLGALLLGGGIVLRRSIRRD